jgi:hypothetical protein
MPCDEDSTVGRRPLMVAPTRNGIKSRAGVSSVAAA